MACNCARNVNLSQDNIIGKSYNEKVVVSERQHGHPVALEIAEIKEEIVFNGIHLTDSDYTTLRSLRSVVMSCVKANKTIRFINTEPSVLKIVLPREMRAKMVGDEGKLPVDGGPTGGRSPDVATIQLNTHETIHLSESTAEKMAHISKDAVDAAEMLPSAMSFRTTEENLDEDGSEDDVDQDHERQKQYKFSIWFLLAHSWILRALFSQMFSFTSTEPIFKACVPSPNHTLAISVTGAAQKSKLCWYICSDQSLRVSQCFYLQIKRKFFI